MAWFPLERRNRAGLLGTPVPRVAGFGGLRPTRLPHIPPSPR